MHKVTKSLSTAAKYAPNITNLKIFNYKFQNFSESVLGKMAAVDEKFFYACQKISDT
jgi:hypothetical protein